MNTYTPSKQGISSRGITDELEALLEADATIVPFIAYEQPRYLIEARNLTGYLNRGRYRVYIGDNYYTRSRAFIQSNAEGVLDVDKLKSKVREYIAIANERKERREAVAVLEARKRDTIASINKELADAGSAFIVEQRHGEVHLQAKRRNIEELEELVARIIKAGL